MSPHAELGQHSVPIYPQTWRRIVKRLGGLIDALRDSAGEGGDFQPEKLVRSLEASGRLYEALVTFIPALPQFLPEYQFNGYTSPEAWTKDEYDEDADVNLDGKGGIAPTFPQFIATFKTAVEVNGGNEFLDMLGKVFDPKMLRAEASLGLSQWIERASTGSPNSLTTSTESPQSGSTTTDPTSERSAGSSAIDSLDFVPRREWMHEPSGQPQMTSA